MSMRVVHIIPAAFDYFNDIRDTAMALVEAEGKMGLEVEAFMLQYGSVTERFSSDVKRVAPTRVFQGMVSGTSLVEALGSFDIIHVHCPLLGLMKKLVAFKQANPSIPLIVTYHRPVAVPDLFALYISWYTNWYLPRLLRVADALVTAPGVARISRQEPPRFEAEITNAGKGALDYFALYHQLVS